MFEELKIESLGFKYSNDKYVIKSIFFKESRSEIVGIIGRNGSGKTTLFNSLTILKESSGSFFINGIYIPKKQLIKQIGYLPQVSFLPKRKKVKYVIDMFPISKPNKKLIKNNDRIFSLLNQKVLSLSGGERRYLEFLLVNSLDRYIYILDEPFSEIEPIYEKMICDHIRSQKSDHLYIISDHKFEIINQLCTQLYVLSNGELIKISDDEELYKCGYLVSKKFNYGE